MMPYYYYALRTNKKEQEWKTPVFLSEGAWRTAYPWLPSALDARHIARVLAAVGLAWLAAKSLGLPQAYWAAISALVVVQGTLGMTVRAGRDRILATAFGAAMGALAGLAHVQGWAEPLVWIGALLPPVALARVRREFSTAPIAAIIVISSALPDASPLAVALLRIGEISVGALVGVAVSRWLLPTSAAQRMQHHAIQLLTALSSFAADIGRDQGVAGTVNEARGATIRSSLLELALIARDSRHEGKQSRARAAVLARSLRRLNEDLMLLTRVSVQASTQAPELAPALARLGADLDAALQAVRLKLVGADAAARSLQFDSRALLPALDMQESLGSQAAELCATLRFALGSARRQLDAIVAA
jgi:uncharacterized membrane protein YccC